MHHFLPLLVLLLLTGCISPIEKQTYWNTQKATWKLEQDRLHDIYRSWFMRGFLEAWAGRNLIIETEGLGGESSNPDGEWALHKGLNDGRLAAGKARLAYEKEQLEKEKH